MSETTTDRDEAWADALAAVLAERRPLSRAAWHGTRQGYDGHRCRCPECRAANNAYHREYQARRRAAAR